MKTLLYKPLFINPQAYYVFPNINGRLEPKTGSGKEPAIFVGNIEVKTIAYGDIGKKQYFYNTSEIDLSAFSGSLVRISLYTSRGNVVLGEWNLDILEQEPGDYIDPKVLDSLRGVWIMDQNTNESESRNIIKNKIADRGGDLELLNFAYKANSGYNGYPEDFTSWNYNTGLIVSPTKVQNNGDAGRQLIYYHTSIRKEDVLEFKVKITLDEQSKIKYWYIKEDGTGTSITYSKSGTYTIPTSYFSKYTGENTWFGFEQLSGGCTIEQLPLYEGALVTDGKDDMIVSQKTVQEMLGGSKKITVVSMIHQIGRVATNTNLFTNCIQYNTGSKGHNIVNYQTSLGKTGIYGYSRANVSVANNEVVINNILGDKADYLTNVSIGALTSNEKFSVVGYLDVSPQQVTSVAVYWTFISNKVLTTDEINQIIAYFKLDKYVTPQVIYDVKRQGLTNDTPAADWYLKDFSGNGHDMQLYNFAKKLGSGIGKYVEDFTSYSTWRPYLGVVTTNTKITLSSEFKTINAWIIYAVTGTTLKDFKVKISGIPDNGKLSFAGVDLSINVVNGDNELKFNDITISASTGFRIIQGADLDWSNLVIEQIPDYEGALVSDGKDDYGKAEGLPILKDYTVAADYARLSYGNIDSAIISKSYAVGNGAFGFNLASGQSPNNVSAISFGTGSAKIQTDDNYRKIRYQSKYVNDGVTINAGNGIDGNEMWLSCLRDNYNFSESALYSMLLFSYSLSEFLLERQLKKYKLGTLYPDMVEFRPVISGNIPYDKIEISQGSTVLYTGATDKTGIYLQEGSTVRVYIRPSGVDEVSKIIINGIEYTDLPINSNGYYYADFPITKSPQKISYVIDEYIRFEDIAQPYPEIWNITQNGNRVSWGDKLKVGSEFGYNSKVNLLSDVYATANSYYNKKVVKPGDILKVEKQMTFACNRRWKLNTTEPHAIYSPQKLNIPNSSLKILGYIPDLTGKGNHGKLNNFAYTEDSGVAADGSIKFDGTDDHITIPTLAHGGKCVMMKVNWNKDALMLYDQRSNNSNSFAIYIPNFNDEDSIAYSSRNDGKTYIDGVLNTSVKGSQLKDVTHNITITNSNSNNDNTVSPAIGSNAKYNAFYAQMVLYEFMLLPDVPDEEEIKELNEVMGIEGGYVESPNYYWNAYGKKNTDTDRNLIADQVSKDVANALEVKNVAYNSKSGYTDDNGLLLDGIEDHAVNTVIPAVTDFTVIGKRNLLNHESAFATKGGNTTSTAAFVLEYGSDKFYNFAGVNTVEYPNTITVATKSSYNNNPAVSSQGVDSLGLRIGEYRNYYSKLVFYKLMLYTKTIDQLSINMLKNLFERDELIDVTNPIFKKQ